ncbi:MAG: 2-C-methyl-D-erythritol 4-phosphate cytidylyltransferase [Candidatus Obscuribacterales bacterium]|nr:2-C-methyl-D-erythritol 4-phosphate cytidylyltransferase [Candidatus Obscuribacterales bacterium]
MSDRAAKSNATTIAAILAAGGVGSRFSQEANAPPKQFLYLCGRPMYVWSLLQLAKNARIGSVVVVAPEANLHLVREHVLEFATDSRLQRKIAVVAGGATRQQSVYRGLQFLEQDKVAPDLVLIHDGARPLVTAELIDSVIDAVIKYGACTPGAAVTDTIKRVVQGKIVETLDRTELSAVQTPQAGRFLDLANAHRKAIAEGWSATDDASMLERDGHFVAIVPGSPYNLKVTQPLDLVLCEALASRLLP